MTNGEQGPQIDFTVDKNNLYQEESITDLKVASIRRLIPVNADGTKDSSRTPIFMAQTQLMSPEGPVPLQSALKAGNIEEAINEFPEAMQKALGEMVERVKKMREQQVKEKKEDSRIIMPGR
ncbi:MAG: cytoplasmic protein [Thermodesulfobacteriota bacterium]|nr:cytoplasmic protein [Thermodesulfobacteriota bacterium]